MKLAAETHRELESFFRLYFREPDLKLPQIEVYAGCVARFITKTLKIGGITVGRRIFVAPAHTYRSREGKLCVVRDLLVHEATHVVQYQMQGFFGFLYAYFTDYRRGLNAEGKWNAASRFAAYYQISHEKEARRAAEEFERMKGVV